MPKEEKRERRRIPLSELTPERLARAMWAESTLRDKPGLDQRARKTLWNTDRQHYIELSRSVIARLKKRAEEGEAEGTGSDQTSAAQKPRGVIADVAPARPARRT
jgi:hypothetical protein